MCACEEAVDNKYCVIAASNASSGDSGGRRPGSFWLLPLPLRVGSVSIGEPALVATALQSNWEIGRNRGRGRSEGGGSGGAILEICRLRKIVSGSVSGEGKGNR